MTENRPSAIGSRADPFPASELCWAEVIRHAMAMLRWTASFLLMKLVLTICALAFCACVMLTLHALDLL